MDHLELTTGLRAPKERVWEHATSIEGISFELAPWLKMTVPRGLDREGFGRALRDGTLPLPIVVGRSWVLLGGVVPFDWDDMVLVEIEPGQRFLERSKMLSLAVWEHERTVRAADRDGSLVTDRLAWETRAPVPRGAASSIVSAIFGHRHRRLVARFGRLE
jgi:ligand-binding SRPBCC domain-containing protein